MDPDGDDQIDPAMAEMMGFSSFGTAPKRRRLASPSADIRPHGTGANEIQLGERRVAPAATDPAPAPRRKEKKPKLQGGGLAAFLQHGQLLPARPAEPVPMPQPPRAGVEREGNGNGEGQGTDYRRGVRNARGDVAYFLPSFLEDPWKGLE